MKRNLDTLLTTIDGELYADKATLKSVCLIGFQSQVKGDENLTGAEKMAQYILANKIVKGGVVDLTAEEITLLKDRAAKCFPALVYGKTCELLEQDYAEPEPVTAYAMTTATAD